MGCQRERLGKISWIKSRNRTILNVMKGSSGERFQGNPTFSPCTLSHCTHSPNANTTHTHMLRKHTHALRKHTHLEERGKKARINSRGVVWSPELIL